MRPRPTPDSPERDAPRRYVRRIPNRATLTSSPIIESTGYHEITLAYVSILGDAPFRDKPPLDPQDEYSPWTGHGRPAWRAV